VCHEIIVLGDRKSDAGDVDFLKSIRTDELAADLPGDANDGRRIEHRSCNACHEIGRSRTGSRYRDSNVAAGSSIPICHVSGTLLMTDQHVMDLAVLQRVVRRQDRAPWVSEDVCYSFLLQALPQNLRSGFQHRIQTPLLSLIPCFLVMPRADSVSLD
jgi:hypothetical protein